MTTPVTSVISSTPNQPPANPTGGSPDVTLVSEYLLDGGSAVDAESGINGTVVGTWTSTATGSLVVGDAGTSMYKAGGTARITLPASQAAHNLNELSISLYYMPAAHDAKHTLIAGASTSGGVAGDFSIEVLTNGRLRGWHYGQDNGLRYFEGSAGVAATNLQIGTAYRITVTFGPSGAKLYLDDALVSSITQNTNGWNNARTKFIGTWVDGSQSPLDGVIDYLRIWDGQLELGGVQALEDAQSVSVSTIPADALISFAPSDFSASEVTTWNSFIDASATPTASTQIQAPDPAKPNSQVYINNTYFGGKLDTTGKHWIFEWHKDYSDEHVMHYFYGSDIGAGLAGGDGRLLKTAYYMHSQGLEFRIPASLIASYDTDKWHIIYQTPNTTAVPNPPYAIEINDVRTLVLRLRGDSRSAASWVSPHQTSEVYTLITTIEADRWYTLRWQWVTDSRQGAAAVKGLYRVWVDNVQVVNRTGQCGYNGTDYIGNWGSYLETTQWPAGTITKIHIRNNWYRYDGAV